MIVARRIAIGSVGFVLWTQLLYAQSGPHYREFQLGGDLSSVSALAGVAVSEAKIIHQRPALIQELQWRLPYALPGPTAPSADPVQQIVFSFYSDQLFRLVIDYDRNRTEGMTDADMIDAISSTYGSISKMPQKSRVASSQVAEESGTRVARWGDADYSVVVLRVRVQDDRDVASPRCARAHGRGGSRPAGRARRAKTRNRATEEGSG